MENTQSLSGHWGEGGLINDVLAAALCSSPSRAGVTHSSKAALVTVHRGKSLLVCYGKWSQLI